MREQACTKARICSGEVLWNLQSFRPLVRGGVRMSEGESLESAQKRFRDVYELLKTRVHENLFTPDPKKCSLKE